MKNITFTMLALFAAFSTSCKKEDKNPSTENIVQEGKWKITYFWDDKDETYHFTAYEFTFNSDGTIKAVKGSTTANGTWSSFSSSDSSEKMIINFGTDPELEELNDDWHVKEKSTSVIKLEDVSGGNGTTEYLTFEKI